MQVCTPYRRDSAIAATENRESKIENLLPLRRELLDAARRAPSLLPAGPEPAVRFLRTQRNPDGGFRGRSRESDLYYTVFAVDSLAALGTPCEPESLEAFLRRFGDGESLDFVHLACLARLRGGTSNAECRMPNAERHMLTEGAPRTASCGGASRNSSFVIRHSSFGPSPLLDRIEAHRAADGGYNPIPQSAYGTAYGSYLALGAYEDVWERGSVGAWESKSVEERERERAGPPPAGGPSDERSHAPTPSRSRVPIPDPGRLAQSLLSLRSADGGFANEPDFPFGSTPATAAVLTVLRHLGAPADPAAVDWLLAQADPQGGFRAMAAAPIPDLLSTATALHGLAMASAPLGALRAPCLDFALGLYSPDGGFRGSWLDDAADCEYTYYALLALGHLAREAAMRS